MALIPWTSELFAIFGKKLSLSFFFLVQAILRAVIF